MLLIIVLSQGVDKCSDAELLFHWLLKISSTQDNAHIIDNPQTKARYNDIDGIVEKLPVQLALLGEMVEKLIAMKKRVEFDIKEIIRKLTESVITSDIDAIEIVDSHKVEFNVPSRLTDACALAKKLEEVTDKYVWDCRQQFESRTEMAVPKITAIMLAFTALTKDEGSVELEERVQQIEEVIQKIKEMIAQIEEDENALKGALEIEMEKLAGGLESEWVTAYRGLQALLQRVE